MNKYFLKKNSDGYWKIWRNDKEFFLLNNNYVIAKKWLRFFTQYQIDSYSIQREYTQEHSWGGDRLFYSSDFPIMTCQGEKVKNLQLYYTRDGPGMVFLGLI